MKMWKTIDAVAAVLGRGALGRPPFTAAAQGKSMGQTVTETRAPTEHAANKKPVSPY